MDDLIVGELLAAWALSVDLTMVAWFLWALHMLWLNWCNYHFAHQCMREYCERQRALREHPSAQ